MSTDEKYARELMVDVYQNESKSANKHKSNNSALKLMSSAFGGAFYT
jgi:hypothetical protein